MVFESVRGYVELASGLSDLTRARAMEVAQGLLSLPAAGIATGSKMAVQVGVLADELLAAATANRSNLTTLVRSEVDVAITHLGLVPVQQLEEAQAEAARLRTELARVRSGASKPAVPRKAAKKPAVPRRAAKKPAVPRRAAKRVASTTAKTTVKASTPRRSAVTTRVMPAGT
jgi:hypothetical protein